MRPEPNNDIDLLLRQLNRRNGASVAENSEQHLDADELNSYVANALPPPARARYTEHLADCSSCRKLAAQLSAAEGPVPAQQSASVVAPSGLKSFLASLFSPMVFRYAVPALGLIVIAVMGFFVFNQNRSPSSVAQLTNEDQTKAASATQPQDSGSPQAYAKDDNTVHNDRSAAEKEAQRAAGPVAPVTKEDAPATATKAAEATGTAAAEPPPPAPKAAVVESEEDRIDLQKQRKEKLADQSARDAAKERADEANKNEPQKTEPVDVTVTPGSVTKRNMEIRGAKGGETNATAGAGSDFKRAPAPATGAARARKEAPEEAKDKAFSSDAETRSVAGRQFRKSGSVWIDTGYDSSKSITTVARGSEQYRALVADEPSIRHIAEQLDGEIIVVWKSRTYRIR
jgi:hypothetical protein